MTVPQAPADVRVYLFTYRRNHLLPRALRSLLAQTHTNWVCELHNDDPTDPYPAALAAEVDDPRITYMGHAQNLGPTPSFNQAFRPVREPFISLLEDDNWWEPRLLEALLAAIAPYPDINLAWSNCHLWRESDTGEWQREGTIWPVAPNEPVTIFSVPHPRQACGALHSNGAMIVRAIAATMVPCPATVPFFAIEPVRERIYPGPFLLVREPLANYALTRETARTETADQNLQMQVLLAMTLMSYCPHTDEFFRQLWLECRGDRGHKHRAVIVAAILSGELWRVLRAADFRDLVLIAGWMLLHPIRFSRLFAAKRRLPDVADFLSALALRAASRA